MDNVDGMGWMRERGWDRWRLHSAWDEIGLVAWVAWIDMGEVGLMGKVDEMRRNGLAR